MLHRDYGALTGARRCADRCQAPVAIRGIGFQPVALKITVGKPLYTPQLFWTPVSLLTGERVLKLDRLSSVKPPFFHPLAAKGGERVEEWTGGGGFGVF